jgi:glycogen debranching enzyme
MRVTGLCLALLVSAYLLGQDKDGSDRGVYFSKKTYTGKEIPSYLASKERLPAPVVDENPEFVELYWRAWELAFEHFKRPPAGSPLVSDYIDEGFAPQIFQWDTIFMIMFSKYAYGVFPTIQSLDNFYCRQHGNGYICREIFEADGRDFYYEGVENTVNPPLFSWAEVDYSRLTGDASRFAVVQPVLEKYATWLESNRRNPRTRHGLYWQTNLGSGMDNLPRTGSGWVDMSAQMVIMYDNLAVISDALHKEESAKVERQHAKEIAERINRYMWNEDDGLYYDLNDDGTQIKCKSVACFWPMLAGVADKKQVEKLVFHLKDPKSFWRTIPFASFGADQKEYRPDGMYWLGSVWAPTNVAIMKGLEKNGYEEFATVATEKYLDGIFRVYRKTGTLWENYAPDEYTRGLWSKPDFVGWTGCGPVQLLIENVIGFRCDGRTGRLTWQLHRKDRHGMERLRFGDVTATVVCDARKTFASPARITVMTNKPFEIVINHPQETKTFRVPPGSSILEVP